MINKFIGWFFSPSSKPIVEDIDVYSKLIELEDRIECLETENIELTKNFPFKITKDKKDSESLVVFRDDRSKSRLGFHIDPYAFDSRDELELFNFLQAQLEPNEYVVDIYFTGNINDHTHTDCVS